MLKNFMEFELMKIINKKNLILNKKLQPTLESTLNTKQIK